MRHDWMESTTTWGFLDHVTCRRCSEVEFNPADPLDVESFLTWVHRVRRREDCRKVRKPK
jgi:hypothetical protein